MMSAPATAGTLSSGTISISDAIPNAQRGVAYSYTLAPSGGTGGGPYTFTLLPAPGTSSYDGLPTGFKLSSSGVISGLSCANKNGSWTFGVTITSNGGESADFSMAMNMTAAPAGACSPTLGAIATTASLGSSYVSTPSLSGAYGTTTWSVTAGAMPAGLTLDPATGEISGTPTNSGAYTFTISMTDESGATVSRTYTVTVSASVAIAPETLATATNGASYTSTITASGGIAPYAFTKTAGTLPTGLTLNTNGTLSGTPTQAGTFTFTVTATDANNNTATKQYTLTVNPANVLTVSPNSLTGATIQTAYTASVTAAGGTAPYSYSMTSGALPTGLSMNASTGLISGTPTVAGTYTFTVLATDSVGNTGSKTYTLTVAPGQILTVNPSTLPHAVNATPYQGAVVASGGVAPYTYAKTAGTLPNGLTLDASTGVISGTPTKAGTFTFTVTATDSTGNTGVRAYTLVVDPAAILSIGPNSLAQPVNGTPYNQGVQASGGVGPYGYAVTSGTMPTGLSLNASTGAITGTPTKVGTYTFTVTGTDADGNTGSRTYTLTVAPAAILTIGPNALAAATNGAAYSDTVVAANGVSPYTYEVTSGAMPSGLTLNSTTGVVSGTPNKVGSYTFTVTGRDADGNTGTRTYTLTVAAGAILTVGPASLPNGIESVGYTATEQATGGVAPYTYSVSAGELPAGLTLNAQTGVISGTPLTPGSYSFTIRAVDADGNYGTRVYTVSISSRPDPSKDAEVIGLIDGQFSSARRFAESQINTLSRHLEGLHGDMNCTASKDGKASAHPDEDCSKKSVRFWGGGSFDFGDDNVQRFASDGLTLGSDLRLKPNVITGAAVGLGFGSNDIGVNGTSTSNRATSLMGYVTAKPADKLFVDAIVGYTDLSLSSTRYVTADRSLTKGKRSGNAYFASLAIATEQQRGGVFVSPYVRYDRVWINLDGYTEGGASPYRLTYRASDQVSNSSTLGGKLWVEQQASWGVLRPNARVEWRHRFSSSYDQILAYADTPARTYDLFRNQDGNDTFNGSVGVDLKMPYGMWMFEVGTSGTSLKSLNGGEARLTFQTRR